MKRLEEIMVEYAREKGGGLPLTPQEMCNAVVLWVQEKLLAELKEKFPAIEGDKGVDVTYNEETNHYLITTDSGYIKDLFTAEVLANLIEGSESIVVDINEAGDKIEIRLDGDILSKINRALLAPISAPAEDSFVAIGTNGAQKLIPVSEVGGGGGLEKLVGVYSEGTGTTYTANSNSILLITVRYKNEGREGGAFGTWITPIPWRGSSEKVFSNTMAQDGTFYIGIEITGVSDDTQNTFDLGVFTGPSQDEGVVIDRYLNPELYGVEVYKLI